MKTPAFATLLALTVAPGAAPQAATFDIATCTPPPGWQRSDQNGIVQLQAAASGRSCCQLFLFPSHPGGADATRNFAAESKDGGATWSDRLCLLLQEISGEVCYNRDPGPRCSRARTSLCSTGTGSDNRNSASAFALALSSWSPARTSSIVTRSTVVD